MNNTDSKEAKKDFLSLPQIVENYTLLHKIGVFDYIDTLNNEINKYRNLFTGALDIFNRTSADDIMDAAVRQISDHFLPSFIVFLWKASKDEIIARGYKNYKLIDMNVNVSSIAPFEAYFSSRRKPVLFSQIVSELKEAKTFASLGPEIVIPVPGPSGFNGLALLGRKTLDEGYNEADLLFLEELMSFVTQSVQNCAHFERTLTDTKTGLYNYGFFLSRLNDEIARVRRGNVSSSLILVDIDQFRELNESHGHLAGEKVLESLAVVVKLSIRTEDIPSRYGSSQHIVLLPGCDSKAAWVVAERLRNAVPNMQVYRDSPLPKNTVSLGICTFNKDDKGTAEEIIGRAVESVRLSKERGRNRTTVWNSGLKKRIEFMSLVKPAVKAF